MTRSTHLASPVHQRILGNATSAPENGSVGGPLPFLNPTRARFPLNTEPSAKTGDDDGVQVEWRSRDNRKGRHILVVPSRLNDPKAPKPTCTPPAILKGIGRMLTTFAWWDVSWWIGVLFSVGSAIFVICGFFYWLPLAAPSTEFSGESLIGGGVTAFIGATLFEIGAVLLIIEAVNENQTACFGWALEQAVSGHQSDSSEAGKEHVVTEKAAHRSRIRPGVCMHHHSQGGLHRSAHLQHPEAGRMWQWWPTWHEFRTHYMWEIGFLGSFTEAVGATIFYVSGIMALPGIYNKISTPVLWGTYWLAYLVGGILFIVSSALYMLETQKKWYQPAPTVLGWWIGVWNMVGSVGWTLSAAYGYCSASWCGYQSDLTLLWASVSFLIGSLLLWYEALDKNPVKRAKS